MVYIQLKLVICAFALSGEGALYRRGGKDERGHLECGFDACYAKSQFWILMCLRQNDNCNLGFLKR